MKLTNTLRLLLVGILGCVFCIKLSSQNQQYRQFTSANGLLSDKAYNLHQDRDGFLWVFSEFGTLKYDGEKFRQVLKNLPLSESFIYCIYERPDGRMWVANSNAHVYEIVNDSAKKVNGFENISNSFRESVAEIAKIVVDNQLNIYLTTKRDCYRMNWVKGAYMAENLTAQLNVDSTRIRLYDILGELSPVFRRSRDDEFYSGNLSRYNYLAFNGSDRKIKLNYESYTIPVRHFKKFKDEIYYTKADKIGRIKADNSVTEISLGFQVLNFDIDANEHIWVGCLYGGLFEIDQRDSVIGRYLEGITVNDVEIDFQNGVWASTGGSGVFRFSNSSIDGFRTSMHNLPISFVESTEDGLIFANSKGDVSIKNQHGFFNLKNGKDGGVVSCVKQGERIYLAMRQSMDLILFDGKKARASSYFEKSTKYVRLYSLTQDTILAVWRRGLTMIGNKQLIKNIDFGKKVTCSAVSRDTIWYGTENGIYYRSLKFKSTSKRIGFEAIADKEQLVTYKFLSNFSDKAITAISVDKLQRKWFAVKEEGIYVLSGGKLHSVTSPSAEVVYSILADGDPIIACTNRGAFVASLKENSIALTRWIKIYESEVQKAFRLGDELYLQVSDGLVEVDLENKKKLLRKVIFRFEDLRVGGESFGIKGLLRVQPKNKDIELVFKRITFDGLPPDIYYELKGPVNQKGLNKSSIIQFNRLPPGNYNLIAHPDLISGVDQMIVVRFEVVPEWYETLWAKIIFAIITVIIFLALFYWYSKREKKKLDEKNKQEQLLLEYKLIALKAQVNPHFISNCLTAIQNLISKGKTEAANQYVARFGLLVRKILDYSSKSLITLSEELEVVGLYVQMEEVRYGKHFDFTVSYSTRIDSDDILVPPLLLNPIVENAIWHGLLPLENDEQPIIEVKIEIDQHTLKIEISDNGVGLSKVKKSEDVRKSYGLDITEQRIKNINYLLHSQSGKVEMCDRHSEDSAKRGVVVRIWLPLENRFD